MNKLLFAAGTSFLRAFGVAALTYSTGILAAPNMNVALSLSVAGLLGALAAGLRAVQIYVPALSFASIMPNKILAAWVDSFTRAFLVTLLVSVTGWLASPDFGTWRAVGLAAIIGALAAGVRALQGILTKGDAPLPPVGG